MKARLLFFFLFAVGKCLAEFTGKRSYYELRILPIIFLSLLIDVLAERSASRSYKKEPRR